MKRKVIAITGGIGSGKSTVAQILRQRGFPVVDCDALCRQLAENADVLAEISALLGAECVVNGRLERRVVRNKVFNDDELYNRYSKIFWQRLPQLLDDEIRKSDGAVFVEIPILDAFPYNWSAVWMVESSVDTRINRVAARDNTLPENVRDIVLCQKVCTNFTYKIVNDGTVEHLIDEVDKALADSLWLR